MSEKKSVFEVLSKIDTKNYQMIKNGFTYLSWAHAWREVKKHYPLATFKIMHDPKGFIKTELGYFVEVSVKIADIEHSEILPVLDYANRPIKNPTVFDINKSHKRCLVKALALHGLGIHIYAGEDIPDEKEAIQNSRKQLIELLKESGKYTEQAHNHLMSMSYDQLQAKINEYSK